MFEFEESLIFYAQKYINTKLARKTSKKTLDLIWGSKGLNLGPDEYGLIVPKDKKKLSFTFTKAELIEGYGTSEWKDRLLARINKIVQRMEK